jgi:hypothetical protein
MRVGDGHRLKWAEEHRTGDIDMGSLVKGVFKAVTSIFTGPDEPNIPKPPELPEPAVMPTPDDAAVNRARQRSIESQRQRRGRASTIFTDDGLGG